MKIQFTTCQARNTHAVTGAIADYLAEQLNLETEFIIDPPWEECLQNVLAGRIQIGWMCGYPYVQETAVPTPDIQLLALPVFAKTRYQNQPIYFSDVIVRRDSPFTKFEDLQGATWAFNEVGSQSGYHVVRYKLSQIGADGDFFGKIVASGAHLQSLEMVLAGEADGAALDSTVMDIALRERPQLANQIRIIEALGPSPVPPWVIHKSVPSPLRQAIQQALTQMHLTPDGQQVLALGELARFETAVDTHYNPIRHMLHAAKHVHLGHR
ncbi:phosphate/phosphite/phosphonate ABC transporter substrate-binding protein [Candidatus Leptofilum sp.]|uniref:phosphate/phosphite/phosphonate ABC transporter substrate-binding protein n=1 Tax=Candidatus Leptofilum sp. TaxID=3241576 RepID=UPI003B5CA6BD